MSKITYVLLLSLGLSLFSINPVLATDDFVLTVNPLSELETGQYPIVSGETLTFDDKPVSDVQIKINFFSGSVTTVTNSTGQFSIISPISEEVGEHVITIYAKKDNRYADIPITYRVSESKIATSNESSKPLDETTTADKPIELDPFSMMLKRIQEQKLQEEKKITFTKEQQKIEEQRLQTKFDLQKDLLEAEKRNESNSPRNVFYRFLQEVDSSVRGIFWQQFLFTEKITKDAQEAKDDALKEGKTSFEATKIFQKKAAVTQQEIIEFNKNLSINYGNATSDVQNLFDENGKLPRED